MVHPMEAETIARLQEVGLDFSPYVDGTLIGPNDDEEEEDTE